MAKETVSFSHEDNMTLPSERLEVYDAFERLEKENMRLLKENQCGRCTIHLYNRKDRLLLSEDLTFPLEEELEVVLTSLFISKKSVKKESSKGQVNQSKEPTETVHEDVSVVNQPVTPVLLVEDNVLEPINQEATPIAEQSNNVSEESEGSRVTTARQSKGLLSKKAMISVLVSLVMATGLYVLSSINGQAFIKSIGFAQKEDRVTWETLVENKQYLEAAEAYPNQLSELEDYLSERSDFQSLKALNQAYPTTNSTFDLAFHNEQWEQVIQTEASTLTKERQVMLAVSYIHLGQLKEADILNRTLKSDRLTDALVQANKKQAILAIQSGDFNDAESIQSELKDDELAELIETGKTCQEMIDHYKEEKDSANQDLWLKRRKNLGGEIIKNETTNVND